MAVAGEQRAHARQQLVALEGLHEVVIGAGVEALHARVERVARREDQDRHVALLAQAPAHLDAVEPGEAQVEHDGVRLENAGLVEGGLAVAGHAHVVALLVKRPAQHAGNVRVVLDDKHAGPSRHAPQDREGAAVLRRNHLGWQAVAVSAADRGGCGRL